MAKKIINTNSLIETSECLNGCRPRVKSFITHCLEIRHLITKTENVIEECVAVCNATVCPTCGDSERTSMLVGKIIERILLFYDQEK